jgi:hypothetical protein
MLVLHSLHNMTHTLTSSSFGTPCTHNDKMYYIKLSQHLTARRKWHIIWPKIYFNQISIGERVVYIIKKLLIFNLI